MSIDFFEQQRISRRQSRLVLLCFILAIAGIGLLIHSLASYISILGGYSTEFWSINSHSVVLIGFVWLTIALGGFFRWLDIRAGGERLAQRFRAEPVQPDTRSDNEKQLLHIVEEMSAASLQPAPSVWVLHHEPSINAFVAGYKEDVVLVVSRGALDLLDREEMQGVVAHEFGHLAHGDLPLNMRLLMVLGGLLAIDEVGRLLTGREPDQRFAPMVIVGFVLRALGSFGVLAGGLIRAAFSRRREYLADASAVQFTRDTYGIASALDQIQGLFSTSKLSSVYAGELSHMCFHVSSGGHWGYRWFSRWLSTHPTPAKRIAAIEPHFLVKKRQEDRRQKQTPSRSSEMSSAPRLGAVPRVVEDVSASYGEFSDRFTLMVSDSAAALAAVFALFVTNDQKESETYINNIGFSYNGEFAAQVKSYHDQLGSELHGCPLAVLRHVQPLLKGISADNRSRLLVNLENILKSEGRYTVWNHATLSFLRHTLSVDFPVLETVVEKKTNTLRHAEMSKCRAISDMADEIALLLSLVVEASGADEATLDADYARVLKCYTSEQIDRRSQNDADVVPEMEKAFDLLQAQSLSVRQAFLDHCAEIVAYDGTIGHDENILLQLFAAALELDHPLASGLAEAA